MAECITAGLFDGAELVDYVVAPAGTPTIRYEGRIYTWESGTNYQVATELSPKIAMLDEPTTDAWGTVTIGQWGGWLVQIMPMIFNDRLVLTPETSPMTYDYGWCYPKGGAAHLAALAWDPATEGEPVGFIKAINPRTRQPGQMASSGES